MGKTRNNYNNNSNIVGGDPDRTIAVLLQLHPILPLRLVIAITVVVVVVNPTHRTIILTTIHITIIHKELEEEEGNNHHPIIIINSNIPPESEFPTMSHPPPRILRPVLAILPLPITIITTTHPRPPPRHKRHSMPHNVVHPTSSIVTWSLARVPTDKSV